MSEPPHFTGEKAEVQTGDRLHIEDTDIQEQVETAGQVRFQGAFMALGLLSVLSSSSGNAPPSLFGIFSFLKNLFLVRRGGSHL